MERAYNMGVSIEEAGKGQKPEITHQKNSVQKSELVVVDSSVLELANKIIKKFLFGHDNYRSAFISHYLHRGKRHHKDQAIEFSKEILETLSEEPVEHKTAKTALQLYFKFNDTVPFPKASRPKFTFIDLFAGIGGFRLALQNLGGECLFTSEWDKEAQKTYRANFGEIPYGDITKRETKQWIPETFDVLCGGFPCQPFSIAGVVKKNSLGKKHGFEDEKQGNLFFHIEEIIKKHRPKAFFLENVKNLLSHDKGKTFEIIRERLKALKYSFHYQVLDGKNFVPQHRQRTFMVGFDAKIFDYGEDFTFPDMPEWRNSNLPDIIEKNAESKYTLSDKLWNYLQDYAKKHKEKGNGFGYGLINPADPKAYTRTISARYYKDGAEILVPQGLKNPRRLTPRECARLQGYPENFIINRVSDAQAYRQFGNSVVVPLIEAIGAKILSVLEKKVEIDRSASAKSK